MSKLTNPEEVLRTVVWYGAHRYDDKPSQFWNQMRIAAEALGDAEAASTFDEYCENGCPLTREHKQAALRAEINRLRDILAALREPSAEVSDAANKSFYGVDTLKSLTWAIRAAVAAAEKEVEDD